MDSFIKPKLFLYCLLCMAYSLWLIVKFCLQLAVHGPSPGVRAGHAAVTFNTKASDLCNVH